MEKNITVKNDVKTNTKENVKNMTETNQVVNLEAKEEQKVEALKVVEPKTPATKVDTLENKKMTDVATSQESKETGSKVATTKNVTSKKKESENKAVEVKNEETKEEKPKSTTQRKAKVKKVFDRLTQLQKSKQDKTIKNIWKMKDKLRFDLAIQRNEVWSKEQKSMLIHSILYGFPIPPVMCNRDLDGNFWLLDGKQRLTTIISFLNNEWELSKDTPDVFNVEIKLCKFEDLTEDLQDAIYDESITFSILEQLTDVERDEMFVRWNSGSTLTKMELTRAMYSELIEQVNTIAKHDFFSYDCAITDKSRNRFVDQEIVIQIAMLIEEGVDNIKGFGSNQIKDYVLRLKEVDKLISEDTINMFKDVSDYLNEACEEFTTKDKKQIFKKIHTPIIFLQAKKALEDKISPEEFATFLYMFYLVDYDMESSYAKSCQSGSSKKENVKRRIEAMSDEYVEFKKNPKTLSTEVLDKKEKEKPEPAQNKKREPLKFNNVTEYMESLNK